MGRGKQADPAEQTHPTATERRSERCRHPPAPGRCQMAPLPTSRQPPACLPAPSALLPCCRAPPPVVKHGRGSVVRVPPKSSRWRLQITAARSAGAGPEAENRPLLWKLVACFPSPGPAPPKQHPNSPCTCSFLTSLSLFIRSPALSRLSRSLDSIVKPLMALSNTLAGAKCTEHSHSRAIPSPRS